MIINLNLDPSQSQGCDGIDRALRQLTRPGTGILTRPFAQVRSDPRGCLHGVQALVFGPQGTPFSVYDANFLPWLRELVDAFRGPMLGICGGMQALALAHGGRVAPASGQVVGSDYNGLRKISGPMDVALHPDALPSWLPPGFSRTWQEAGGRTHQSHVEQVIALPLPWRVVASSAPTPIEAFAHPQRPILASQFHPECGWEQGCGAGRLWLESWLQTLD